MRLRKAIFALALIYYGILTYRLESQTPPATVTATRGNLTCTINYIAVDKRVVETCSDNGKNVLTIVINPQPFLGSAVTVQANSSFSGTPLVSNAITAIITGSPGGVVRWQVAANGASKNGTF